MLSVLEQLNDSPESIILKSVLTGMNEYYSLNLSREIKKGLTENALKMVHNGGIPPLGYDLDESRKYIVNCKEAEIVKLIFKLASEGIGFSHIANILNEKGYKNKKGKEFKKTSIRDTLLNQKYIGTYFHGLKKKNGTFQENPIIIENAHEAIIDKKVFFQVQNRFKEQKNLKGPRRRKENNIYYLTGYCRCGECGGTYSGGYRATHVTGITTYGYECRRRRTKENTCKNKPIFKKILEPAILNLLKSEILTEDNIKKLVKDVRDIISKINKKDEREAKKCEDEIDKNKKMLLKLLDKNLEGFLSEEIFEIKCKELNERISILERKLYSLSDMKNFDEEKLKNYFLQLKNDSNHSLNQKLIESFLHEVIIYNDRIEVIFRRFPKGTLDYLDLENMCKDGGSRGLRLLYKKYGDDLSKIEFSKIGFSKKSGYYQPATNTLVAGLSDPDEISKGVHKFSVLAHEYGHKFDNPKFYKGLSYKELELLNEKVRFGKIQHFKTKPSSSDEFLKALRLDKEILKSTFANIKEDLLSKNSSGGVQDALDGMFNTYDSRLLPIGHGNTYYNGKYNKIIKPLGLEKKLKEAFQELGMKVKTKSDVRWACRDYETASEAFANIASAVVCGGEELEYTKKYMSNMYEAYLKIVENAT